MFFSKFYLHILSCYCFPEKDETEVKEKDTKENMNKADQQVLQAQSDAQRALQQAVHQQQAMAAAQQHAAQQAVVQQHQAMAVAAAQMGLSQQQGNCNKHSQHYPNTRDSEEHGY